MPSNKLTTGHGMGPENVDSIRLAMVMRKGDMVGDSVIPLGLEVFRLTKPLPSSGLTSDTSVDSYYDPSAPIASTIYNATVVGLPDSIAADYTYSSSTTDEARVVYVKLPQQVSVDRRTCAIQRPRRLPAMVPRTVCKKHLRLRTHHAL